MTKDQLKTRLIRITNLRAQNHELQFKKSLELLNDEISLEEYGSTVIFNISKERSTNKLLQEWTKDYIAFKLNSPKTNE